MNIQEEALLFHEQLKGKIDIKGKAPVTNAKELSLAYTPGVAEPCRYIAKNKEDVYKYTGKGNMVAVVTDGSAVLGLGNIGPEAGMPVMEGKCVLFKTFGGVDAIPLCVRSKNVDEIVQTIKLISGSFGGINLEDISAPRCFEIEKRLKEDPEVDIPVFHDDQHGTAVVCVAACINALKLVGKKWEDVSIVFSGAGAAGEAIAKLMISMGAKDIVMCDRKGIIYKGRTEGMNMEKEKIAEFTNKLGKKGSLADALKGADIFVGVSSPGVLSEEMVASMNKGAIVMPMANPTPEIMPEQAIKAGAAVVGTGRSDYPNQINNVLAFPGIFRGALDCRATDINEEMKIAAAQAIASLVSDEELKADYIIPAPFDNRVGETVAKAVKEAAIKTGVNRI